MKSISIILLSTIFISGCAMWPSIKSDKDLMPADNGSNDILCYKPDHAKDCALLTIHELSGKLEQIGDFNRGAAYTALGLGTAAASVLTFGGGKQAIEGLAVASGSLLGLNTVVNTATQKEIYEKALKDVTCGLRARNALLDPIETTNPTKSLLITNLTPAQKSKQILDKFNGKFEPTELALLLSAKINNPNDANEYKESLVSAFSDNLLTKATRLVAAHSKAESSADTKLSTIVIETRADVRRQLATISGNPEDMMKNQRGRIIDMLGDLMKKKEELKQAQNKQPPKSSDSEKLILSAELSDVTSSIMNNASPAKAVFGECVDPAVQELIKN